ncbi:MAG: OadG family protein [Chitinispirillaceae bacterium]|nr:OadG family protein [Chitinispirillaceae bacterium]
MIAEGILIMGIGIGMVFLFFMLLILTMNLLGLLVAFLNKKFPESVLDPQTRPLAGGSEQNAPVALAIAAAKRFSR